MKSIATQSERLKKFSPNNKIIEPEFKKLVGQAKFLPLGETALIIDLGDEISIKTNEFVLRLADRIAEGKFDGIIELVPAYASLAVFYDLVKIRRALPMFPTAFAAVESLIREILPNVHEKQPFERRLIEVPICFAAEFATDLEFAASENGLTIDEFKTIFLQTGYTVFMLGFLPGFAYMGEVDRRIRVSRKSQPRNKIPDGSVGIADRQTGIYPLESPGGWQIIGRTPLALFDPNSDSPAFFQTGNAVRFREIERIEFDDFAA